MFNYYLLFNYLLYTINSDKDILQNKLKKRDLVRITTKESKTITLKILEIISEAIVGEVIVKDDISDKYLTKQQILFSEISEIERKQFISPGYAILGFLGFLVLIACVSIVPAIKS